MAKLLRLSVKRKQDLIAIGSFAFFLFALALCLARLQLDLILEVVLAALFPEDVPDRLRALVVHLEQI